MPEYQVEGVLLTDSGHLEVKRSMFNTRRWMLVQLEFELLGAKQGSVSSWTTFQARKWANSYSQ